MPIYKHIKHPQTRIKTFKYVKEEIIDSELLLLLLLLLLLSSLLFLYHFGA